jgi:serine/threonine-protein kinase RsbW
MEATRVMRTHKARAAKPSEATTFDQSYPGVIDQVRNVRADVSSVARNCPVADDLVLLTSELVTNAILHSRSGRPNRVFTVRATFQPGDYAWVEVVDEGGAWACDQLDDEHGRGLGIVSAIAGNGNWGIDGDAASRVAWFRLDWPQS